jgi:hypothetical protein
VTFQVHVRYWGILSREMAITLYYDSIGAELKMTRIDTSLISPLLLFHLLKKKEFFKTVISTES